MKGYSRLPPATGIPFAGFDFAKIAGRQDVEKRISQFVFECGKSEFLNVGFIRAEWGEGKTDAYERYLGPIIRNQGDEEYLISTSTLRDKVANTDLMQGVKAVKFLAAIFSSIGEELKARGQKSDRAPIFETEYRDPLKYVEQILDFHLADNCKRLFLFIDEFEEILSMPSEVQKSILSGIKELVNGQFGIIHQGGKYAGRLHLIIACTPYAYNRIKEEADLVQIFGAIASRIAGHSIDLPQMTKHEAFQFLVDLLKYSYDAKLPAQLPIASGGVFSSVVEMSQKNPRALVQLFVELMSAAGTSEDMKLIDYTILIRALEKKEISVYGGTTKCIDPDLYLSIHTYLKGLRKGDSISSLFDLFIGELYPFTLADLASRIGIEERRVMEYISSINVEAKRLGIQYCIVRFLPLLPEKSEEDIRSTLKPTQNEVHLINQKIQYGQLLEFLVSYELTSTGEIRPIFLIPEDYHQLETILDIDSEDANYLHNLLRPLFADSSSSKRYMLSQEMITQLFPSPIWNLIDFVKERPKRMELWREVVRRRTDLSGSLNSVLADLTHNYEGLFIEQLDGKMTLHYTTEAGKDVRIPILVESFLRTVNPNDVAELQRKSKLANAKIIFLFHSADIDDDARQDLAKDLTFISLHLKPIHAQQLLVGKIAVDKGIRIDDNLFASKKRDIYRQLELPKSFERWRNNARKSGLVVADIHKEGRTSDSKIADAARTFVNLQGIEYRKAFAGYEKLNSFKVYGKPADFSPSDIEKPEEFDKLRSMLYDNGFLSNEDFVKVLSTPIEERILHMLREKELSDEEIENNFIIIATSVDIIKQVYLPILVHKGRITKRTTDGKYVLVKRSDLEAKLEQSYEQYSKRLKDFFKPERIPFCHICVSKEREDKVIMLEEYSAYLNQLFRSLSDQGYPLDDDYHRQAHLIISLIEYSKDVIEKRINIASTQTLKLFAEADDAMNKFRGIIDTIIGHYNIYSQDKLLIENLDEYRNVESKFAELKGLMTINYSKNNIEDCLKAERELGRPKEDLPFFYANYEEKSASLDAGKDANYLNYKYYKVQQRTYSFIEHLHRIERDIAGIMEHINRLNSAKTGINGKVLMLKPQDRLPLARALLEQIRNKKPREIVARASSKILLSEIAKFFSSAMFDMEHFASDLSHLLDEVERIKTKEMDVIETIHLLTSKMTHGSEFLSNSPFASKIDELRAKLSIFRASYSNLLKSGQTAENRSQEDLRNAFSVINTRIIALASEGHSIDQELEDLKLDVKSSLSNHEKLFLTFMAALGGGDALSVLRREFQSMMTNALDYCGRMYEKTDRRYQDIVTEFSSFRKKVYKKIEESRSLSQDESIVFFELLSLLPEKNYVSFVDTVKTVSANLAKDETEVVKIVTSLVDKKLILLGISHPF